MIGIILLIIGGRIIFINTKLNNTSDGWDSREVSNNSSNYYKNWIEPTKLLRICGTYEYIINDFYHSFLEKDNSVNARKNVTKYIEENKKEVNDKNYTGIFKYKNLIFVMMESMDDWMVNEETTPTMYEMMNHGFNFTNHYSPGYVTGETANTEFVANTGMYPSINKLSPNYAYVNNDYPYSIANLFKKEGYITNSFHASNGFIYNRINMHIKLGYNQYHNYADMGIDDKYLVLDSYIIRDGYNQIVQLNDKFIFDNKYGIISPYFDEGISNTIYKYLLKEDYIKEEISEKIRLFYVALTRAKEKMILVTDLNQGKKSKDRIKYRSFKDIMLSVIDNFNDYITNMDIEKLDITKDYKKIKQTNYLDYITKTDEKLDIKEILIENEELDEKSFSKKMTKLITKEENDSIKFGLDMHYALEVTDFINPNFDNMDNFIKNKIIKFLDNDLLKNIKNAQIYKEYEFVYEEENEKYHGIIDLMLIYPNHIDIIDYKLKNIIDENYINQLNGYKKYIEKVTGKDVYTYLYSIIDIGYSSSLAKNPSTFLWLFS